MKNEQSSALESLIANMPGKLKKKLQKLALQKARREVSELTYGLLRLGIDAEVVEDIFMGLTSQVVPLAASMESGMSAEQFRMTMDIGDDMQKLVWENIEKGMNEDESRAAAVAAIQAMPKYKDITIETKKLDGEEFQEMREAMRAKLQESAQGESGGDTDDDDNCDCPICQLRRSLTDGKSVAVEGSKTLQ